MAAETDRYEIHQLGALWFVVNSRGRLRSQGYHTEAMAEQRRALLEAEQRWQGRMVYREGPGHV